MLYLQTITSNYYLIKILPHDNKEIEISDRTTQLYIDMHLIKSIPQLY